MIQRADPPAFEVQSVTLVRNSVQILAGIDWEVERGQTWVVLGPNGCGKSTLLRTLLGYEWPTTGRIVHFGEIYGDGALVPKLREKIGWVGGHLDRDLDGGMTCLDAVCSGWHSALAVYEIWPDWLKQRAQNLLAQVGVGHLQHRAYALISAGERQRVMLCRALINDPKVLLLDEPCAGLDPAARADFLAALSGRLRAEGGLTCIFVTHHVEEVVDEISHGLLMQDGRIIAQGPLQTVFKADLLSRTFGRTVRLDHNPVSGWSLAVDRRLGADWAAD